jgi:hypothetical protein
LPYSDLPPEAFWRACRDDAAFRLDALFAPKFDLVDGMRIATAGSCFAQNIGRYVRRSSLTLVDMEPAPALMPEAEAARFGYGLFSARSGNIYTARQLRQLLEDAEDLRVTEAALWVRDGRYYDGLRPNVESEGLESPEMVAAFRMEHLRRVRAMFDETDVFVFTLGLTETWADRESGLVFPTAPGVIAGRFDPARHEFVNLGLSEVREDLDAAIAIMRRWAPDLKILLTVSPVPLTATAGGAHVLSATTFSKSVLRAVAGEVAQGDPLIDYVPSYEVITGAPFAGRFYNSNLRTVTEDGVATVMAMFFGAYPSLGPLSPAAMHLPPREGEEAADLVCEEAMLEAFAKS